MWPLRGGLANSAPVCAPLHPPNGLPARPAKTGIRIWLHPDDGTASALWCDRISPTTTTTQGAWKQPVSSHKGKRFLDLSQAKC